MNPKKSKGTAFRIASLLLAFVMLAGCGGGETANTGSGDDGNDAASNSSVSTVTYDAEKWADVFPVSPTLSIEESAKKVDNSKALANSKKIASEKVVVSDFESENGFKHQPGFAYFKGKFYATWAQAAKDEDSPGQSVVMATSTDFYNWSEPFVIGPSVDGGFSMTANQNGFFVTTPDRLYYYYRECHFGADNFKADGTWIPQIINYYKYVAKVVSTTDGENWTDPVVVTVAANESPKISLTGRYFAGAGDGLIMTDDICSAKFVWKGISSEQSADGIARGASILEEASWYQTDDYVIHLMIRSNTNKIWMSESYDNGETFTDVYPTNFSTEATMANFGRLPDGRYYFVGTSRYGSNRYPLVLQISDDGYNFDREYILRDEKYEIQQSGWAKDGYYAYPEVLIQDDYMYIFYSKQKEVMELTRIKLSDIV